VISFQKNRQKRRAETANFFVVTQKRPPRSACSPWRLTLILFLCCPNQSLSLFSVPLLSPLCVSARGVSDPTRTDRLACLLNPPRAQLCALLSLSVSLVSVYHWRVCLTTWTWDGLLASLCLPLFFLCVSITLPLSTSTWEPDQASCIYLVTWKDNLNAPLSVALSHPCRFV
jgi:hypothetical protein